MPKILLVEDEKELNYTYSNVLREAGIGVDQFFDVATAREAIQDNHYDGYLLDLDINNILYDGLSLVPDIQVKLNRNGIINTALPILIISWRATYEYKTISQKFFTAWETIQKPVEMDLLVNLTSLLIKFSEELKSSQPSINDKLLMKNGEVYWDNKRVHGIAMIPYRFLECLTSNIDKTVTFNELYALTNGYESDFAKRNRLVRVHINRLRQSFKDVDPDFNRIKSSRSMGFLWSNNE